MLSLLTNILTSNEDLKEYVDIFEKLDVEHVGYISYEILRQELKQSKAYADCSEDDWESIL